MTVPKKVLLSVTSYCEPFYADGKKTGLFYTEALHPYNEFIKAGFEVDVASETGKYGLDEHSLTPDFMNKTDFEEFEDKNHGLNKALANLKKASDLNPKDYGIFFASAGHATLFDYPNAVKLQNIAADVWARGGIVSAVCHGPAILPKINGPDGKPIISGKNVTGFTTKGEEVLDLMSIIKGIKGTLTIEEGAASVGAKYHSPKEPFDDFTQVDGRLVTGANPASAKSTAVEAIKAFQKL